MLGLKFLVFLTLLISIFVIQRISCARKLNLIDFDQNERNETVILEKKRDFIKHLTQLAWWTYLKYAAGHEALNPADKTYFNPWFGNAHSGLSMIAPLTTFWVMDLKQEWSISVKWLLEENKLKFNQIDQFVNVHKTVTEYVAPLLSCYALTGNVSFLEAAQKIEQSLEPAWTKLSFTDLPYGSLNPKTGARSDPEVWLSWAGGQQLEFMYMAQVTNNSAYSTRISKVRKILRGEVQRQYRGEPAYADAINVNEGEWSQTRNLPESDQLTGSLNEHSSGFYTSLIKSYIWSNRTDSEALEMYRKAMDSAERIGLFEMDRKSKQIYARSFLYDQSVYRFGMSHSACYLGAMLTLGGRAMAQTLAENRTMDSGKRIQELNRIERHFKLAVELTETCHQASLATETGLPPAEFHFSDSENGTNSGNTLSKAYHKKFGLTPELAESYFILYRHTKNPKYREYAWDLVQSLYYCKDEDSAAFSTISDVDQIPTLKYGYQPPIFLSATLKYLYLTFTDSDVLPLDRWVFNEAGHPLPIAGKVSENEFKSWVNGQ